MTLNDQIKQVLKAHPETLHSKSEFAWQYGIAHFGFNPILGATTKDNFKLFTNNLCPFDLTKILKNCLARGMEFNWKEDYRDH